MMTSTTQKSSWLTKEAGEAQREWYVIDATGHTLGRLATRIAMVLRGKHKATYTPNVDMGDFVIVTNASAVRLTGNKADKKLYQHHTLYPGGLREIGARKVLDTKPENLILEAVTGMLPKNKLRKRMVKRLKVYAASQHPHEAQRPEALSL